MNNNKDLPNSSDVKINYLKLVLETPDGYIEYEANPEAIKSFEIKKTAAMKEGAIGESGDLHLEEETSATIVLAIKRSLINFVTKDGDKGRVVYLAGKAHHILRLGVDDK